MEWAAINGDWSCMVASVHEFPTLRAQSRVEERLDSARVAAASGPEPHPGFMEFYLNPTVETREVKIEGQRTGRCRQFPFRSGFATFVQAFKGRLDQRVRR